MLLGRKGSTVQVLTFRAAARKTETPEMLEKLPPMYTVFPSSDVTMARTVGVPPLSARVNWQLSGCPVSALKTASAFRFWAVPEPPAGGRICEKVPPATTFPFD